MTRPIWMVLLLSMSLLTDTLLRADPPATSQARRIKQLIRKLGNEHFREREAASRDLAAIGEPAEHALRRAMHDADLEVRHRAAKLVEALVARKRDREMAALHGLWVLKTTEYLGEKAEQDPTDDDLERLLSRQRTPAEERELVEDTGQRRTMLAFKGGTFEQRQWVVGFGGRKGCPLSIKGTYRLDVDRSPMVMVKRWEEHGIRDEIHVTRYIYSVRGDTLLMGVSFKNNSVSIPTQFATAEDEDMVLLTFKREKK